MGIIVYLLNFEGVGFRGLFALYRWGGTQKESL